MARASLWLLLVGCAALSGCASKPGPVDTAATIAGDQQGTASLLQQARRALDAGEFGNAATQLQPLGERNLSARERIDFLLLSAELHLAQQEPDLSAPYLTELNDLLPQASNAQEIQASLLKARWYEATGQYLAAARERDFQAPLLSGDAAKTNHERIWQNLMLMPEAELLEWAERSPDTQFGHWLQLAAIARNSRLTLDEQVAAVSQWQQQHSRHPAALSLPGGLAMLQEIANERPQQVALLLPLSGPLEKTGHAIRDGFMAAYYESLNKGFAVPRVRVYDSQQLQDVNAAYAQAQFDGAEWLVGPVNKQQVQNLQERDSLPLPTLALNYGDRTDNESSPANLYQYGLAAEDEAVQIAEKAWADGKRRALVLVPQGNWGERIYRAFSERWLALGGDISEQRYYPNRQDYNPDVRALLNVDESQRRYQAVRRLLRQSTEFEPRRRQDADWIFMVALPQQARQIKPTLAFNFAADLPVYATSHLYTGEPNSARDRDLNGIQFCDVPWLLQSGSLQETVEKAIPGGQGSYARLYAMGVDAFRLLPRLKQLEVLPHSQVFGSTGALMLDSNRRIVRRTECTIFENGRPVRIANR